MDKRIKVVLMVISFIGFFSMNLVSAEEESAKMRQGEVRKIVYADFLTIYYSYNRTKEEDKKLKQKGDEIQKKIDAMKEEIKELEKKMDSGILSEEKKKRLAEEIEETKLRLNRKIKDYNLEIESERRETIDKLIQELRLKITEFGKERGFTLILDAKDLLFADTGLDVTKEIVDYINKKTEE